MARGSCCAARDDDAMATEKTAEGIRKFAADIVKLEKFVASKIK
jgi:transaldolase